MNLQKLRRQQVRETKPIGRGLRQGQTEGLSGSLALEATAGLEQVVIKDLSLDKGGQTEVAFEAAERARARFEVRPFPLQAVVIGFFKEGQIDSMGVGQDLQVTQGTGITPQAVGEDFGVFQLGTAVIGHRQSIACGLSVTTGREVVAQIKIVAGQIGQPKPPFMAPAAKLSFIGQQARFPADLGRQGEGALVGQQKGGLVAPAGNSVMRDLDAEQVLQGGHDRRSWQGPQKGEVESQRYRGWREAHARPTEDRLNLAGNEADLLGVDHRVEARLAGPGQVDFVSAMAVSAGAIAITAKAPAIGQNLENAHGGTTAGAVDLRILAGARMTAQHKLTMTGDTLTAIALQPAGRIVPKAMDRTAATRAMNCNQLL
jgi:hypothetical protein